MKTKLLAAVCGLFVVTIAHAADKASQAASPDRTLLPIPDPAFTGQINRVTINVN